MTEEAELRVAALPDRYNVARSQIYARIDALKQRDPTLAPWKRGKKAYADQRLIEALDAMHVLINQGDTVAEAADKVLDLPLARPVTSTGQPDRTQDTQMVPLSDRPSDLALLAGAIAANQPPPDPLDRYRALDEIAAKGWQLPTSEIAELLGMRALSGQEFERYGFRFIRVGKAGAESTWKVEKLS
ncbi:MAG: hypothetical protein AAGA83_15125 [Cyanobacteria bacterium P01_F01_bin.116]